MPQRSMPTRLLWALSWLIICSPIWIYLADFSSFGRVQHNDYYVIVGELTEGDRLTRNPLRWLDLKSNEHRATLPTLVYALNIALTDGHNLGLTFFSLLLLTLILVWLVALLPADVRSAPGARTGFGFALALFCYTPLAAHNVAMGFSGSIWFFANALTVAAMGILTRRAERGTYWTLWPVLLLGIAAAFTHSTHLVLWPALLAGALFLRLSRGRLILLGTGMALVAALFAISYESLAYHPEMNTRDPMALVRYTAVYLGSLFSGELVTARTVGLIGIATCGVGLSLAVVLTRASKSLRSELAPWLMLQLYGLGNAMVTAIGRSGFGEMQAMSSRYASLAALFWIGLLTPLGILAWRYRPARPASRGAVVAGLIGLVAGCGWAMHARGAPVVERFAARGSRQEVAALALVNGIRDDEIIEKTVAPWPIHVWNARDYLMKSGHVPFDRERPSRLNERVDPALLSESLPAGSGGYVDRLTKVPGGFLRLGGWAYSPEAEVGEILVLDDEGTVVGEIVLGIHRPDLARLVHQDAFEAGWEGYVLAGEKAPGLQAYVQFADDPKLYLLPMSAEVRQKL